MTDTITAELVFPHVITVEESTSQWEFVTFSGGQIGTRHFPNGCCLSSVGYELPTSGLGPILARVHIFRNCKGPVGGSHSRYSFHPFGTPQDLSNRVAAGLSAAAKLPTGMYLFLPIPAAECQP